ncbi:MAG TPA: hypothetical protein VFR18_18680 [Terriglobia bacterium]|nr:hypothetical protein [Terriglobia bacterium]
MHLSSEQVLEWTLGERCAEVGRHLADCRECREELVGLQDGLRAFRQSAHDWADAPVRVAVPDRLVSPPVSWGWAGLTAMVIGLALFPLYLDIRETQREAESVRDSLLLDQVQTRLARTVPQSMEPLMELMAEEREGGQ